MKFTDAVAPLQIRASAQTAAGFTGILLDRPSPLDVG